MRLLLLNHTPLDGSGSGIYLRRIAEWLTGQGHTCAVLVPAPTDGGHAIELHPMGPGPARRVARLPFPFPTFSGHRSSSALYAELTDGELADYLRAWSAAIRDACAELEPDVIHVNHLFLLASAVARSAEVPYVVVSHGSEFFRTPGARFAEQQEAAGHRAAGLVGITRRIADVVADTAGRPAGSVSVIPPGFDPAVFRPRTVDRTAVLAALGCSGKRPCVAYAGRIVAYKRVPDLVAATALIPAAQRPDLLVVGDGTALDEVRRACRHHDVGATFAGHHTDPLAIADLFAAVDLVVLPSADDPYPMTVIEALACATPALISDRCGVTDIVGDAAGAIHPLGDVRRMADLIGRAMDENWKATRGPHGPARVAGKRWSEIGAALLGVYRSAVAR